MKSQAKEQEFHITLKGVITKGDKILFFKKKGYDGETYLDLPGGRMKEGEDMAQGFTREMREETGVDVEMGRVLGSHIFENRLLHGKYKLCAMFIKTELQENEVVLSEEHSGTQWLSKKQIIEHPGYRSSAYITECKEQLLAAFH